jgi:hypothetical protein
VLLVCPSEAGKEMVLTCEMVGEGGAASVQVKIDVGNMREKESIMDQVLRWGEEGRRTAWPRLAGRAVMDMFDGEGFADAQPVFVVEVIERRR